MTDSLSEKIIIAFCGPSPTHVLHPCKELPRPLSTELAGPTRTWGPSFQSLRGGSPGWAGAPGLSRHTLT